MPSLPERNISGGGQVPCHVLLIVNSSFVNLVSFTLKKKINRIELVVSE